MLTTRQAAVLGLIHGPTELLPVSSSGHTQLIPALLRWPYPELPDETRKTFEVALHAGTLVGLLRVVPLPDLRTGLLVTAPAAVAGLLFEHPIEQRLGTPRGTAAGLIAGSLILVLADQAAGRANATNWQHVLAAGRLRLRVRDAVALGVAQALALIPGLSRLGVAVAVARLRGAPRRESFIVGRSIGLPVIVGATVLKTARVMRAGIETELRVPMTVGFAAAAGSAAVAAPLARRSPVLLSALWRVGLAVAVLRRRDLRQNNHV